MSKGSGDRVRDRKRYDENYERIDWSGEWDRDVVEWRRLNAEMVTWWCAEPWPELRVTPEIKCPR